MASHKLGKGFLSRENLFKYSRTIGAVSYAGLGVAVSQPGLIRTRNGDLTNVFLAGSLVGGAMFLYERPHLAIVQSSKKRVWISVFGSSLFSFGSLLLWAIFKSGTRGYNLHPVFHSVLSLAGSYLMLKTGLDWLEIVEKKEATPLVH